MVITLYDPTKATLKRSSSYSSTDSDIESDNVLVIPYTTSPLDTSRGSTTQRPKKNSRRPGRDAVASKRK
jgi:hypothetical protein